MASASSSSGGLLSSISYTHDGSFLLAASGHVVKLFSAATGAQVRTLEALARASSARMARRVERFPTPRAHVKTFL